MVKKYQFLSSLFYSHLFKQWEIKWKGIIFYHKKGDDKMDSNEKLKVAFASIGSWGKFTSIVTIIMGAVSAVFGLFAFVVGAIPGIIEIFLGVFLLRSANGAARAKEALDPDACNDAISYYAKYVKLQAILLIIAIVLIVISAIFAIVGVWSFSQLGGI